MNIFPTDVLAIPQDRINEWRDSFELPWTPERFWEFYSDIKETFYQVVKKYHGTFMGDLLLTKIKIYQEYTKSICALNLIRLLDQKGISPLASENSFLFKSLIAKNYSFQNSLKINELSDDNRKLTLYKKFRHILYSMRVNSDPLYFINASKDGMNILNVMPCRESIMYVKNMNKSFFYASPREWLAGAENFNIDASLSDEIRTVASEITEKIKAKVMQKYQMNAPDAVWNQLNKFTVLHMSSGARDLNTIQNVMSEIKPTLLLGGNQSSFFNRAMALCNRKIGGKSIGFNHGNDAFSNRDMRFELSIVNEFVTYTDGGGDLIRERDKSMFPEYTPNEPEIRSLNTPLYLNTWKKFRKMPLPEKVKRVMVMGYPFDLSETLTLGAPDVCMLHFEMNVIKTLVDAGYDVICKAHPESCIDTSLIYKNSKVFVTRERFEEVMEYSDAFVFLYSYTSVFPLGLCVNKPAVLLNALKMHRYHTNEVYEILNKRCKVIDVFNDEKNRLAFNKEELLDYLGQKPQIPDTELLEKYMFPKDYKDYDTIR